MKKAFISSAIGFTAIIASSIATAADYVVDTKGSHAFVQFRVKHLGYSWLYGRFNDFSGEFTFDEENPQDSKITIEVDAASLDSNHAERDKHLRSPDFLDVDQFPTITFESTSYTPTGENTADLTGNLTLHGVTKEITINVENIGGGDDPWGGYRQGFEGEATLKPDDYGIDMVGKLGPASAELELILSVEGIRQ